MIGVIIILIVLGLLYYFSTNSVTPSVQSGGNIFNAMSSFFVIGVILALFILLLMNGSLSDLGDIGIISALIIGIITYGLYIKKKRST
jgi:hypothetical protein